MQLLAALAEQLKALWMRWSIAQRIGISLAAVACVAIVAGTMYWATRVEYVVVANQLTPQRAAEIMGALETQQIDGQLSFSGSEISVPRSDFSRARLALKDVIEPTSEDTESFSGLLPGSPRQEDDRRRRSHEQRLARSIEQIRGVRSATVHISAPDPSPFAVEKTPVTASIIVDPAPNGAFSSMTAQSIVSLVSRAVEGLTVENVSLMDTAGRQYSVQQGLASSMGSQFEYQQRIESHLAGKAESMLAQMLGPGRAVVRVTADIDFRETTRTEQTYDPDLKVKRQETIESTTQSTPPRSPAGSGTEPNIPSRAPQLADKTGAGGGTYKHEVNSVEFDNASLNEVTRDIPGRVTRVTVAAIVDIPQPDATAPGAAPPAPAVNQKQVEEIIKQAVGFDLTRNDEVKVLLAPLERLPDPGNEIVPISIWQQYESLIQSVVLGTAAMIALTIGFMLLRRMKPVIVSSAQEEPMSISDMRRVQSLAEQAKANPEVVASILAAWLSESENDSRSQDDQTSKSRFEPSRPDQPQKNQSRSDQSASDQSRPNRRAA